MAASNITSNIHYVKKIEVKSTFFERTERTASKFFTTTITATDENGSEYIFSFFSDEKIEIGKQS